MDWERELITLFFLVIQNSDKIFSESMRLSPNSEPEFTDAELMTIYLYCTKESYHKKSEMYNYVKKHLLSWFPKLPSYQAFNHRLNLLEGAFRSLCNELLGSFFNNMVSRIRQPIEAAFNWLIRTFKMPLNDVPLRVLCYMFLVKLLLLCTFISFSTLDSH